MAKGLAELLGDEKFTEELHRNSRTDRANPDLDGQDCTGMVNGPAVGERGRA